MAFSCNNVTAKAELNVANKQILKQREIIETLRVTEHAKVCSSLDSVCSIWTRGLL